MKCMFLMTIDSNFLTKNIIITLYWQVIEAIQHLDFRHKIALLN